MTELSPLMTKAIIGVGTVGTLAIGAALTERKLYKIGREDRAALVNSAVGGILVAGGIIGAGLLVISNPLWGFFR